MVHDLVKQLLSFGFFLRRGTHHIRAEKENSITTGANKRFNLKLHHILRPLQWNTFLKASQSISHTWFVENFSCKSNVAQNAFNQNKAKVKPTFLQKKISKVRPRKACLQFVFENVYTLCCSQVCRKAVSQSRAVTKKAVSFRPDLRYLWKFLIWRPTSSRWLISWKQIWQEEGRRPLRVLKTSEIILKLILTCTGSQCTDFKTGVISFWSLSAHGQPSFRVAEIVQYCF